jgi:hypothetical protein
MNGKVIADECKFTVVTTRNPDSGINNVEWSNERDTSKRRMRRQGGEGMQ